MKKPYIPHEAHQLWRQTLRFHLRKLSKAQRHFVATTKRELFKIIERCHRSHDVRVDE